MLAAFLVCFVVLELLLDSLSTGPIIRLGQHMFIFKDVLL